MNKAICSVPLAALVLVVVALTGAQDNPAARLTMEDVMSGQELKDTGVTFLTPAQKAALDTWLNRYTQAVAKVVANQKPRQVDPAPTIAPRSSCNPAVESTIAGDFNGWEGETIFKLDNGQIWQQAEYDYSYSYSYRPDVTIYQAKSGCVMKVEDEDETILVRRIK